jgi:acyl-CoA synthetase (AMP-forming)/AMP-acid ligase II
MSFLSPELIEAKAGSIGTPIQDGKFSLLKHKKDEEGELVYEGENVCMGYAFDCSDLERKNENNGLLKTGDIAKIDKDGFYFITGRKKRILKLYGNRLNLDYIENKIQQKGFNCVCLGNDMELKIFTTDKNSVKDINNYLINNLNVSKYMFNLYLLKKIPRNSSGKIIYSQIEENNSEKIK